MPDQDRLFPHLFEQPALAQATRLGMRTVLVVDDNVDVANVTAEMLREIGHEVEVVHDGHAAIEAVDWLNPDVVLLDIALPGLNGYEVATRIRANPRTRPTLRIIGVTGWGAEGHSARSCTAGFDKFWSKPLTIAELMAL